MQRRLPELELVQRSLSGLEPEPSRLPELELRRSSEPGRKLPEQPNRSVVPNGMTERLNGSP